MKPDEYHKLKASEQEAWREYQASCSHPPFTDGAAENRWKAANVKAYGRWQRASERLAIVELLADEDLDDLVKKALRALLKEKLRDRRAHWTF